MLENLTVIKRTGKKVPYNSNNVYGAIQKGFQSVLPNSDSEVRFIFRYVEEKISKISETQSFISVNVIQDLIVQSMRDNGYNNVADSYDKYRHERDRMRAVFTGRQNKLVRAFEKLTMDSDENPDKKENANVDGNTAMGTMLQFGATISKEYAKSYIMSEKFAQAHDGGDIHIHDMDFMAAGCTTTCTQIPLDKLFKRGFNTGHGYLRPPKGISSYAALACIAIQSNQNDQHGGQAVPLFDYYMAPGVLQTYKKIIIEKITEVFDYEEVDFDLELMNKIVEEQQHIDFDPSIFNALIPSDVDNEAIEKIKKNIEKACRRTFVATNRATYQAMEALVANLNTMHSRCGAQVPFSSINYGTDTSLEGRMVIKNLLLAEEDGLGDGETPIFPISIFKVKEGVNYFPEDPNYDLLLLACRVTCKRLFPNFAFLDAPFNKVFYKEGVPESEVGYMGCVAGDEVIVYKVNNDLYIDEFKTAYERVSKVGTVCKNGQSEYVDTQSSNICVYDSIHKDFVKVKKFIKNPNRNNWTEVVFDNNISILATDDHPFHVIGKGRTFVKDIKNGDKLYLSRVDFVQSWQQQTLVYKDKEEQMSPSTIIDIFPSNYCGFSYDVETETDLFDVSGVVSHNCRTRVMTNVHNKENEIIAGRGNLSFTTINLPRLGIKHGICNGEKSANMEGFFADLDSLCDMVKDQLLERFKHQGKKKVKNFPFLMGAGVWIDSERLNPEDTIEEVLKNGTLTIGFIGLSECLKALTGKHHAESEESQKLGLKIIGRMREKCDAYCRKYKLNFSLIATPAEGTAGRFTAIDRARFGVIPGVTDKEYYTNSCHVDVSYPISVADKMRIEAPYHELTNGGHIAYVELDGLTASNPEAILQVVQIMHDAGVGYGAINHPVDRDPVCGYTGIIGDTCPRCGRHDGEAVSLDLVKKYKGSIYHSFKFIDKPVLVANKNPNKL